MPLSSFTPAVREWFEGAFDEPTPVQAQAWPAIASGEHVLISAPTGSGKTLAAFLSAIDRLTGVQERHIRVVYVSPLKALSYDVERNLRAPLRGIRSDRHDTPLDISVAVRTGDTSQKERMAIRRDPPDILITTPESLYLMLTSQAREVLRHVETVIVDEIHAVAGTKRGSHLALTLERLERNVAEAPGAGGPAAAPRPIQRIGLSATQNPLEEIGRFLVGPRRACRIIDAAAQANQGGWGKELDVEICVPVESMVEPDRPPAGDDPLDPGGYDPGADGMASEATRRSIWPAMYPQLLELVRSHRSTIVFVNNRRGAERLALRLNELANADLDESATPQEIARAHHGSLAREERLVVEELLKAGKLPCLVATSSLELGIDMGAVDLVLQVESPKSVSRGLQRIGRAGHGVGDVSKGRIFPKFRADLLESAVVVKLMREGRIEPTVVPRNALDVLAQQIVAIAASTDVLPDGTEGGITVDEVFALATATHSYAELPRPLLENVLDMLDGRYPSAEFGELRPRIVWDRVAGVIRPRKGARQLAIANAGTIPDRGLYSVVLPDGRRVGELDEEMVYEARAGQTFLLGASSWRIEEIGRDRVVVTPAPGVPGAVPFWRGDSVGRPKELGEEIGRFSRWAVDQSPDTLREEYSLDAFAAGNLIDYLREQQEATKVVPSDRTIVVERFRDEIGDWRLCILSPFGGRIHAAWALALSRRLREEIGLESDAIWSDDGIIVGLPDADEREDGDGWDPIAAVLLDPDEVEDAVVAELGASALFGARFRENAGRALLIPRAYPGRRTPLWQQRLKSQTLLEVAKRYSDFPIVLETYRECLRDVLDVPGLVEILTKLHRREISLVDVETQTASPFASSLLFDYVATYMYEGDTPNAERRAAALSLDRDLLRELLGQEELRDLIDRDALATVEADLQHLSDRTRASTRDELAEILRRIGDLTADEARLRTTAGCDSDAMLAELDRERRAIVVRVGGEQRWIAADDAGLYRDALGVVPPGGLPDSFVEAVPDALAALVARYSRSHGPFTTEQLAARYAITQEVASLGLRELERRGDLLQGELHPDGTGGRREWCDPEVLRRLRRASLAVLRKEIEASEQQAVAAFLPSWQGVDRHPRSIGSDAAGVDRLREVLVPLQGLALPVETWERDVLPRRTGAYSPVWLDRLCASGEVVWVGAGSLGRNSGRVALYFRDDAAAIGPPNGRRSAAETSRSVDTPEHDLLREQLSRRPCFFSDIVALLAFGPEQAQELLWDLVWAGEVTNDAWAPLRAPKLTLARGGGRGGRSAAMRHRRRSGTRFGTRSPADQQLQGRWSLTTSIFGPDPGDASDRRRTIAELLLERYGIVTREHVLAEGVPGGFALLYDSFGALETLGVCRRGYFVEGLGGAQFALPSAVERLRAQRESADAPPLVLAATDPAQPYGASLPWPRREESPSRGPQRVAGAYVVLVGAEPVLYVERGGKGLQTLVARADDERIGPALEALSAFVLADRRRRLPLERVDGKPVVGSGWEQRLIDVGFRVSPRKLTLSA